MQRLVAPRSSQVLLFSLAQLADPAGHCQPTMQVLKDWTGLHERTIQRHLKALNALGLVRHKPGIGARTSSYTLIDPDRPALADCGKAVAHA